VTLNRAVAAAMVDGPAVGLVLLATLDERLAGHHRLDAVRAHLLEMSGDREAAIAHYRTAAGRTTSVAERDYLLMRAAGLTAGNG
jgi:predicted RNA polymerase sigma factor